MIKLLLLVFSIVCFPAVGIFRWKLQKTLSLWTKKCGDDVTRAVRDIEAIAIGGTNSSNRFNSDLSGILSLKVKCGSGIIKFNPSTLIQYLAKQINYFKNKILYIFDDFEKPLKLRLKIPDFNLLNFWPDLKEKVTFSLYDKTDGNSSFDKLTVDDEDLLKKSRFNSKRPTVLITHGFWTSSNGTSVTLVRDAYLKKHDFNVISVNWSPLSIGSYTVARLMVSQVGNHVGKLINFLYKHGMDPNTTTLVGYSLGAHVMGFAGQTATYKVNHAIGLDPAWPLFIGLPIDQKLSNDDAHHVEIIHTNGGLLGAPEITGDYDFYPNGGTFQNGCDGEWLTACSHSRSYKYLAEQIEGEGLNFVAVQCNSYGSFKRGACSKNKDRAIMGAIDKMYTAKGFYYLDTNKIPLFGLGHNFLKL